MTALVGARYNDGDQLRPTGVLELTPSAYTKSGAIVVKVPPGSSHQTRLRFKIFAGGNRDSSGARHSGGAGYGAFLMPRAEWDRYALLVECSCWFDVVIVPLDCSTKDRDSIGTPGKHRTCPTQVLTCCCGRSEHIPTTEGYHYRVSVCMADIHK